MKSRSQIRTRIRRHSTLVPLVALLLVSVVGWAHAQPLDQSRDCGREAFSRVFDAAGARLRALSQESQPRLRDGLKELRRVHGWSEEEEAEKAEALLMDAESRALDDRAAELLAALDRLAAAGSEGPGDCARLSELEATAAALAATVRRKSELLEKRIAAAIGPLRPTGQETAPPPTLSLSPPVLAPPAPAAPTPAVPPAGTWDDERTTVKLRPLPEPRPRPSPAPPATQALKPAPKAAEPSPSPAAPPLGPWQVTTRREPGASPGLEAAPAPPGGPAPPGIGDADGYTIEEIRAVARDVFGVISTSLASVIEHAFARSGRPSAYVLGQEGGVALIAGVRYGQGRLYLKGHPPQRMYWHGPSLGYDFGAAGSRTLFLVYGARGPQDLMRNFTGIDGAAYLVGGAGITFLTDGQIVLAPIRSGIGLRLGASIGYVRFTERPTWLPF